MPPETKDFRSLQEHFNAMAGSEPVINGFISRIIAERADLADKTFYAAAHGNADVVMVDDEVFKTAPLNDPSSQQEFMRELDVLTAFTDKNVPFVPHLKFVSADKSFFSMTKLDGVTLGSLRHKMSDADILAFAADFGRARALIDQALDGDSLPLKGAFNLESRAKMTHAALDIWDKPYVQETINQLDHITRYLLIDYQERQQQGRASFCHADLHHWNILVDPDTKKLTGFIDMSRSYQSAFPEAEFDMTNEHIQGGHDFITASYAAYCAEIGGNRFKPTDPYAFELLRNIGVWHQDSDQETPETVKILISGCVNNIKRTSYKPPGQG
jgi:aminoglycoside phosphotransferase